MPDPIEQQVKITGDASGGAKALDQTARGLDQTEKAGQRAAAGVQAAGGGVLRFLQGIASGIGKVGAVTATSGALAAKGLGGIGVGAGLVVGKLTGLGTVISTVAAGIGNLIGTAAQMAGTTKTAEQFGKRIEDLKSTLLSPIANFLVAGMKELNQTFANPAVQKLTRQVAALIQLGLQPLLGALKSVLEGVEAFAEALNNGDVVGALQGLLTGIRDAFDNLTGGAFSWGLNLISTFVNGLVQGANQLLGGALTGIGNMIAAYLEGHSPPKTGPLSTIDRWGVAIMNAFLSGFQHADFTVLDQVGNVIKSRLQTLVDRGDLKQTALIPQLVGSQAAVAQALAAMRQTGSLTDAIIGQVRAQLAGLGPATQDFVEAQLRALDATRAVAAAQQKVADATNAVKAAQADVAAKQAAVAQLQREQDLLQRTQAARAAELVPLQDQLRAAQDEQNRILQAQEPRRAHLRDLADQQRAAEQDVAALQAQQAALLQALAPLRDAVAVASERQRVAELAVQQAQDAMLPLQDALNAAQEQLTAAQDLAQQHAEAFTAQIDAQREATDAALASEQAHLDAVTKAYNAQIAEQQKLLDAVDAKWKRELDGANAALAAANRALLLADRANRKQLLQFAQQRDAASAIQNPNERIAALARINRAETIYNGTVKDRLARLQLEAQVRQDETDAITEQKDAEKKGAADQIATLQSLLAQEQQIIQDRMAAVKAEGDGRIAALQAAAKAQAALDKRGVDAASARVRAAQADVAAAQAIVTARQREAELAARAEAAAQHELTVAEDRIHQETDGAIAAGQARAQGLADQGAELQRQLDLELRGTQDRIDHTQRELDIRQSGLDAIAAKENAVLAARLQAAQDDTLAAQGRLDAAQQSLDAANAGLDVAKQVVDQYQQAAQLAQDRIDAEAQIAALRAQEAQLLQQDKPAGAGAKPSGIPAIKPDFANPAKEAAPLLGIFGQIGDKIAGLLAPFGELKAKWDGFVAALAAGVPFYDAVRDFLSSFLPPDLADKLAAFVDGVRAGLAPILDNIGTNIGPKFQAFVDNIQPGLQALGDIIGVVAEVLGGVLAVALIAVGALVEGIVNALPQIGLIFSGVFDLVGGILNTFMALLTGVVAIVVATIKGDFAGGMQAAQDAVQGMGDGILQILNGLFELMQGIFIGAVNLIIGIVQGLVEGITGFFSTLYDDLVGHSIIPDMVAAIQSAISGMVDTVLGFVHDLWQGAVGIFNNLLSDGEAIFNTVSATIGGIVQGIVTTATNLFNTARDNATAAFNTTRDNIGNALGTARDLVGTIIGNLRDTITSTVGTIVTNVGTGFDNVKNAATSKAQEIFNSVTGTFGNILGTMAGVGKNFVDGLLQGVQNAWGKLTDKIHELALQLPEPLRDALGIHSPADATQEVAEQTVAGLTTGFDDAGGQAVAAVQRLAAAIVGAFQALYDTLITQTTDGLATWFALFQPVLDGVFAGFDLLFGTGAKIALLLFDHDTGFFARLGHTTEDILRLYVGQTWETGLNELQNRVVSKIQDMTADAGSAARAVGEAIAMGLEAGILALAQAVANAAAAVVNGALASANQAAGNPHSPAPAFVPLGRTFSQGLAHGMTQAVGFVQRAGTVLVQAAQTAVQQGGIGTLRPAFAGVYAAGATVAPAVTSGALGPTPAQRNLIAGQVNVYQNAPAYDAAGQEWHATFTR